MSNKTMKIISVMTERTSSVLRKRIEVPLTREDELLYVEQGSQYGYTMCVFQGVSDINLNIEDAENLAQALLMMVKECS